MTKKAAVELIKYVSRMLLKTAVGKAIMKSVVIAVLVGLFTMVIARAGMLPRSPLATIILPLSSMVNQIPYFHYVAYFVPTVEIMALLYIWIQSVIGFHILKFYLRAGRIIK